MSSKHSDDPHCGLRWFAYAGIIAVAAGVLLASILNVQPLLSANDRSRWETVWSLVERGTYQIDEIDRNPAWTTIDKVRHEGHFYSSKPPLLATLVASVYRAVKASIGWNLTQHTAATARLILVVVNLIPLVVALVVLARLAERYARTSAAKLFVVFAGSFATLVTTFAVTLNNHTPAAVGVVLAIYPAMRILIDGRTSPWLFAACGFFAAFTSTNELPAALFGLAMFGLLLRRAPGRTLAWFVPAALVPLAAYFWTNWLVTGGIKPFYMYYGTEKYEYVHEGVPSYWMDPKGLDRATDSPLVYVLHCTVGHHGILSLSPIFLLTLAGWALVVRDRLTGRRGESDGVDAVRGHGNRLGTFHWLGLVLTVVVLGFYLTRTENYNYGGNTAGLRWLIWLTPFWLVSMIPALDRWGDRLGFRMLAVACLFVSTFSATYPLGNPWTNPWLFTAMERLGWIHYPAEAPPAFPRPLTSWFPSLPDRQVFGDGAWIELAGPDATGGMHRVRLTDAGRREIDGTAYRQLDVRISSAARGVQHTTYFIDEPKFAAGADPTAFLAWPEREPSARARWEAAAFVRGVPQPRPYREGLVGYLKTPLRGDAFACQRAAVRVAHRPTADASPLWYRTDLWLSGEVPFGVVQVETTITDPHTGATVQQHRLTAVEASGGVRRGNR